MYDVIKTTCTHELENIKSRYTDISHLSKYLFVGNQWENISGNKHCVKLVVDLWISIENYYWTCLKYNIIKTNKDTCLEIKIKIKI